MHFSANSKRRNFLRSGFIQNLLNYLNQCGCFLKKTAFETENLLFQFRCRLRMTWNIKKTKKCYYLLILLPFFNYNIQSIILTGTYSSEIRHTGRLGRNSFANITKRKRQNTTPECEAVAFGYQPNGNHYSTRPSACLTVW